MQAKITSKLKEWTQSHLSPLKIDFMSLNRLRLNLSADSTLAMRTPYTEQSRAKAESLQNLFSESVWNFNTLRVVVNPFGTTPLTALLLFHTDTPCQLTYTVQGHQKDASFCLEGPKNQTSHAIPIFGLYPGEENLVDLILHSETGETVGRRTIHIQTETVDPLLDSRHWPVIRDSAGDIRYFLSVPAGSLGWMPLSGGRFLIAEESLVTPEIRSPRCTHLHEFDLLGFTCKTYYIGSGISGVVQEKEPGGNLWIPSFDTRHEEPVLLEADRQTGAIVRAMEPVPMSDDDKPEPITYESFIHQIRTEPKPVAEYLLNPREYAGEFSTVGWLTAPRIHKGASIATTNAVDRETLFRKYELTFTLCGDTLQIEQGTHRLQEILFSKNERIYQMDLSEYLPDEEEMELLRKKPRQSITIPFTEMHSGTYYVILRFVSGEQEVLEDTITLSRTRQMSAIPT